MVTSLFKHEQLETTDVKAKQLRPVAEKMSTLAKRGDLHARRQALGFIKEKAVTHTLFEESKDRFLDRQGGYIRIVKKGIRKGDGAPMSVIQLLPSEGDKKKGKKTRKTSKTAGVASKPEDKSEVKVAAKSKPEIVDNTKKEEKAEEKVPDGTEKKDTESEKSVTEST